MAYSATVYLVFIRPMTGDAENRVESRLKFKSLAMKKLLFLLLMLITAKAKSQNEDALLADFVNSADFEWVKKYSGFGGNWKTDPSLSFVAYEEYAGIKVPVLTIALVSQEKGSVGKYNGQVQAIRVKDSYKQLPHEAGYLMLYRDLSAFDTEKRSGTIRIYDLNYDGYQILEAKIEAGNVKWMETHDMPLETIAKYDYGDFGKTGADIHFCDKNHNGDVSWGECFICLVGACQRNWTCQIMCNILNLNNGSCLVSIGLACIWMAIQN